MEWEQFDITNLTADEYKKWYNLLNSKKKTKTDSFRFENDKKRTVAGEMLARKMISEKCSIPPESIVFDQDKNGKPFAVNADIHFNISHSENTVVCVIEDESVGIDIEYIRPVDLKTAKRFCKNEELAYIFGKIPNESDFIFTENHEILSRFFEVWTGKESIVKCSGAGISEIQNVNFSDCTQKYITDEYVISIKTT